MPTNARTDPSTEMNRWVDKTLAGMSLEEKVGQLFVTPVNGQSADESNAKNRKEFGVDTPAQIVRKYHVGGVIYFDNSDYDNIDSPKQVAQLSNGLHRAADTSGAKVPLQITTDQEGGLVARLTGPAATEFPGNMSLGASRSTDTAYKSAAIMGSELKAMGIDMNNAPDADVNSNPANPVIGVRSFSSNPELTGRMTAAAVHGYQGSAPPVHSVGATAKHFPGHGDAATDSHTGLPVINRTLEQWRKIDAVPFRSAIKAGVESIMTAHIVFPKIDPSGEPATLSKKILTGLLRDELGYQGVVTTDSLRMQGVRDKHSDAEIPVLALKAGVDQLLMPVDLNLAINSVLKAVRSGELTEARIDTSVKRILTLKYQRGLNKQTQVNVNALPHRVGTPENKATAQRITDAGITAVRNDAKLLPLKASPKSALVTGWGDTTTQTLATAMGKRGTTATAMPTGTDPTDAQIASTLAAAKANDLTVVLTNGTPGGLDKHPQQLKLLNQLTASGKPVVAVAVRNPYDVGFVDGQKTWLATYFYGAGSMESLTRVIYGEVGPKGELPVDVPDHGDVKTIKYPFGTGLSW
jgi:beta-N-acetylhexosaminidase